MRVDLTCNGQIMISMITDRLRAKQESGFTLIELLVVIVILGLLAAIAIPAFLNQQNKAKDSEVEQYLNTAYKVAKAEQVSNDGDFPASASALETAISDSEPQLDVSDVSGEANAYAAADSLSGGTIGVFASGGGSITLVGKSDSGKLYQSVVTGNGAPTISEPVDPSP